MPGEDLGDTLFPRPWGRWPAGQAGHPGPWDTPRLPVPRPRCPAPPAAGCQAAQGASLGPGPLLPARPARASPRLPPGERGRAGGSDQGGSGGPGGAEATAWLGTAPEIARGFPFLVRRTGPLYGSGNKAASVGCPRGRGGAAGRRERGQEPGRGSAASREPPPRFQGRARAGGPRGGRARGPRTNICSACARARPSGALPVCEGAGWPSG